MDNTTHLEKAIVFAVTADGEATAEHPFGVETIDKRLEARGLEVPLSDLDMGLPQPGDGWHVHLSRPAVPVCHARVPQMLRENYDVDYLFRKIQSEGIW